MVRGQSSKSYSTYRSVGRIWWSHDAGLENCGRVGSVRRVDVAGRVRRRAVEVGQPRVDVEVSGAVGGQVNHVVSAVVDQRDLESFQYII